MGTTPNDPGTPEWKLSAINPMQLSGGLAKGRDLRGNIEGAIDVYNGKPGRTEEQKLEAYNGQANKHAYGVDTERRVNQIRADEQVQFGRINNWNMRDYRPPPSRAIPEYRSISPLRSVNLNWCIGGNMRVVKIVALLLVALGVFLPVRQLALRARSQKPKQALGIPEVEVISAIPRSQTGYYALGDIAWLDSGEAWAVGYDSVHTDRLYHSKDAGKKIWEPVKVAGNGSPLTSISFSDSLHGWVVGGNGLIIRTTDGGKSWDWLKPPTDYHLHKVHFLNSRIGYVAGRAGSKDVITDEVTGSLEIFCTADGGANWRKCYKQNQPSTVFNITTPSESTAFIVLDGNRLIRTDDQGATWQPVAFPGKYAAAIGIAPDGTYWLVGRKGVFEHSEDAGATWPEAKSFSSDANEAEWWEVAFSSDGTGLAVADHGLMAITLDGGKSWQVHPHRIDDHLRAVRLHGSHALILGAENLYYTNISSATQLDLQR